MSSEEELIHYSRQIILPEIDAVGQDKLRKSKMLVVGLGGLGSAASMYLASAGVGHLVLVDDDKVERSNLQRQIIHSLSNIGKSKSDSAKRRLDSINPFIETTSISQRLTEDSASELLKDVDIILDCSDNYKTRQLLNQVSLNHKVPLIQGSAIKFNGHVSTFNQSLSSPCYKCVFEEDVQNNESCEDQGVFPPIVGIVGTMQASEAMKIIIGCGDSLDGYYLTIDLLENSFRKLKLNKRAGCSVCANLNK